MGTPVPFRNTVSRLTLGKRPTNVRAARLASSTVQNSSTVSIRVPLSHTAVTAHASSGFCLGADSGAALPGVDMTDVAGEAGSAGVVGVDRPVTAEDEPPPILQLVLEVVRNGDGSDDDRAWWKLNSGGGGGATTP